MAEPRLTNVQLGTLRARLEEQRAKLNGVLRASRSRPVTADESSEFEEEAQRESERAQQAGIVEHERALLAEVERALAKLDAGTYGVSETTGEPIAYARLLAMPWARHDTDE
jgi:DnaK suppressor protein